MKAVRIFASFCTPKLPGFRMLGRSPVVADQVVKLIDRRVYVLH